MISVRGQPGLRRSRRTRRWWWVALAAVSGVLAAGIAGVLSAPPWLQALCVAIGVASGVILVEVQARSTQTENDAIERRTRIAGAREHLPVRAVSKSVAGVDRAILDVPYVVRDAEAEVERALHDRGRVLIVGPAMAGKSRLALHVTQRLFPEHHFVKPRDGQALHQLVALDNEPDRVVLWLDRLETFLAGGLTSDDLDAFRRNHSVTVATISSKAYDDRLPKGDLKATGWDVLQWFAPQVWLTNWTPAELERADAVIPPQARDGARRLGLSVYLGAGELALDQFRAGEGSSREGHAVVRAAADWRRAGRSSAIARDVLVSVLPAYLSGRTEDTQAATARGLDWATTRLNDTVALIEETSQGYDVLDVVVEFVTQQGRVIPEAMWDAAEQNASTEEVLGVALQAARNEREDRAEAAWQRAAEHPLALYNLGALAHRRGDDHGAERWWRAAAEAGDPGALYRLEVLLAQQGSPEARHWAQLAAQAATRTTADKLADAPVRSADATITFSGAPTDAQKQLLTAALRAYMGYLERLHVPLGAVPTVHIDPGIDASYPDPRNHRLFVGGWLADDPGAVLHEYSHWVLDGLASTTRDAWNDEVKGIESGLAYYLPCSSMNSPRITALDLRAASYDPPWLGVEHRRGLRWAAACWELRGRFGQEVLDRPLIDVWQSTPPSGTDAAGFADRLSELLDGVVPSARQVVQAALVRTGVLDTVA